jgi:hypothetical protein
MTKLYCVTSPCKHGTRYQWFRREHNAKTALRVTFAHARKGETVNITLPGQP